MSSWRSGSTPEKRRAWRRARRLYPVLGRCESPGCEEQAKYRHHPDIDREPDLVQQLCGPCHVAADKALGKNWHHGRKRPRRQPRRRETARNGHPEGSLASLVLPSAK